MSGVKATQFKGTWEDRLEHLFDCEVEWSGKSVLDVGCNMGVVGYEVSKRGIASYHGIDVLPGHLDVARGIFMGVPIPSVIESLHMPTATDRLQPHYDVVLYLAVHQHIRKNQSDEAARKTATDLFRRCDTLIFRGPDIEAITEIAWREGFNIEHAFRQQRLFPLIAFTRK